MDGWRPLSVRDRLDSGAAGPFEGVPEWMCAPLTDWVTERYPTPQDWQRNQPKYRNMAMALRLTVDGPDQPRANDDADYRERLLSLATSRPELLLEFADYWLSQSASDSRFELPKAEGSNEARWQRTERRRFESAVRDGKRQAERLREILALSGSVYTVQSGEPWHLARRVAAAETTEAHAIMERGDRAAQHIATAWTKTLGRDPDATSGYRAVVKAVEAAVIPMVQPRHELATLGTVIGELKSHPEKVTLRLGGWEPEAKVRVLTGMLNVLWKGQTDRHGSSNPDVPAEVALGEAEDALRLAILLIGWFTTGGVRASGAGGEASDRDPHG